MIVCHCNVLCSERIASEVESALQHMPAAAITPAHIYERCRCAPNCGGCREIVREIIGRMAEEPNCAPVKATVMGAGI